MIIVTMPIEEYQRLKQLETQDPYDAKHGLMAGRTYGEWRDAEASLKVRIAELEARLLPLEAEHKHADEREYMV